MTDTAQFDRRLTVLTRTAGSLPDGQPSTSWQAAGKVWARVRHTGGTESVQAGGQRSTITAIIKVRSRAAGFSPAMRLQDGSTVYDVHAVYPNGAERGVTELRCGVLA